jgi:uncharacterized protein (TIGR03437 family)
MRGALKIRIFVLGLSIVRAGFSQSYTISTFAGGGTSGGASGSMLSNPQGLAADSAGNIYIADIAAHVIWKLAPDATLSVFAGTEGKAGFGGDGSKATQALLNTPRSIAIDKSGTFYIADTNNNRIRKVTPDGIIQTFAGPGVAGVVGDGGPPASARINSPYGVAVDGSGNVFIAETANNRVRLVYNGVIQTIVGINNAGGFSGDGGFPLNALLSTPWALVLDGKGNLYIDDAGNNRVRKVTPTSSKDLAIAYYSGTITTVAGGGPSALNVLSTPRGVAIDAAGNLYIADTENSRVLKFTTSGWLVFAGTGKAGFAGDDGAATAATLARPTGITSDGPGNVYISDHDNGRIRKIAPTGVITTVFPPTATLATSLALNNPRGVALDGAGNMYIADSGNHVVRKVALGTGIAMTVAGTGVAGFNGDTGPATQLQLNFPVQARTDNQGNLYIVDDIQNTRDAWVRKVSPDGIMTTFAGTGKDGFTGDGGPASVASLSQPEDIAFDLAGNSYIADVTNNRIRQITPDGIIHTIAGTGNAGETGDGGSALAAQLNTPRAVATDGLGNLYVGEYQGNRLRRISKDGTIQTLAGDGRLVSSGDGGPAISSSTQTPCGLAVDGTGSIYLAEWRGNRIRKIDAAGVITTIAGTDEANYGGDGGNAQNARLNTPTRVAVDNFGNIYVADSGNNRIRKLTPPPVFISGVVNAASSLFGPVAPGQIVNINGNGLGPAQSLNYQLDNSGLLSTTLGGTQAIFDGVAAPLLSAQANQVTAVVPYEVSGTAITHLQIVSSGSQTNTVALPVAATAPGIFTQDSSGKGPGMILNADSTTNSPLNPALRGSVVTISATGEGQTNPPGVDGLIATSDASTPVQPVSVQIGDATDGAAFYTGGVPGQSAGFFRVAVQIPDDAPTGDAIPIVLIIGSAGSQPGVTISIQ